MSDPHDCRSCHHYEAPSEEYRVGACWLFADKSGMVRASQTPVNLDTHGARGCNGWQVKGNAPTGQGRAVPKDYTEVEQMEDVPF